jgi:hypothetical protein
MSLGEVDDRDNIEIENLFFETDSSLRETLNNANVADVDRTTRTKLINE